MPFPLKTAPRDFALGPDGDLLIGTDLQLITDEVNAAATVQAIRIALQSFANEWFLDLDSGMPYWELILAQKRDRAIQAARIAFRSEILAVEGVDAVVSLDITFDGTTRDMNVAFVVRLQNGETAADTLALAVTGGVA